MIEGSTFFIAGGSGTWGNELTDRLLKLGAKEIRIFSRGEKSQVIMKEKFAGLPVRYIIGDVRDYNAISDSMWGSDCVINLAALKHIGNCENQPLEAIKTNVDGNINIMRACIELKIKKFIIASTDKAVYPSNLYGMTKGIDERMTIQANALTNDTDFICIRAGNVIGSSGSVIPVFINAIKEHNAIMLTDGNMTRFFSPVRKIISTVLTAIEKGIGGEIYIPKMPSFYIYDLADIIVANYGNKETKIIDAGGKAGEKVHEMLVSPHEFQYTYEFSDHYVILPSIDVNRNHGEIKKGKKLKLKSVCSSDFIESRSYLYNMLESNGFINK